MAALHHSYSLVTARRDGVLIRLGNIISDGHRVVYFRIYWYLPIFLLSLTKKLKAAGRKKLGFISKPVYTKQWFDHTSLLD